MCITILFTIKSIEVILLLLFIIIKRGRYCKAGREWFTPYQSKDPNPTLTTYQSEIYRRGNVENDWNSLAVRRSPSKAIIGSSSAFQSFPIIPNAGSAAFPMLALVGNARDSVL